MEAAETQSSEGPEAPIPCSVRAQSHSRLGSQVARSPREVLSGQSMPPANSGRERFFKDTAVEARVTFQLTWCRS